MVISIETQDGPGSSATQSSSRWGLVVAGFVNHTFILGNPIDDDAVAPVCNGHSTFTKLYFALNWIRGAFAF